MCKRCPIFAVVALGFLLLPSPVLAQSGISGVVKDTTGAVLPGVTVEASSPALIEKVRATATDENGQYRVIDLRPGTYTVTFTLTGFSTIVRDGIVLETEFHGADQRRDADRRGCREHHRHRRDAGGRRADQLAPRRDVA